MAQECLRHWYAAVLRFPEIRHGDDHLTANDPICDGASVSHRDHRQLLQGFDKLGG